MASSSRALWIILALALVLRVGAVAITPGFVPSGDPADYDRIGATVSVFDRFPVTQLAAPGSPAGFRPPGYPLLLAGVYEVAGPQSWTAARLAGALLGVLAVLLLYLLVARAYDRRLALWSAGVAAVAPALIDLNFTLLSESLFIPLVLGLALCVARQRERGGYGPAVGAGLLLGAAVLTRSNGLSLALPVVLGLRGAGPGLRRVAPAAVALACLALTLVPWTLRNESAYDAFLPLGTQAGYTMAGQWNASAAADGAFHAVWQLPENLPGLSGLFHRPDLDEGELDDRLRAQASAFARDHPGQVVTAAWLNAIRSFDLGPGHTFVSVVSFRELALPGGQDTVLRVSSYVITALALAGLALGLRRERWRERGWLWLLPALILAGGILWVGNPRKAAALFPFLAIAAGYALMRLSDARRHR